MFTIIQTGMPPSNTWEIGPVASTKLVWGARRGLHTHTCPTCGIQLLTGRNRDFVVDLPVRDSMMSNHSHLCLPNILFSSMTRAFHIFRAFST